MLRTLLLLPLVVGFANGVRLSDFIRNAHMTEESFLRMQLKLTQLEDIQRQIRGEEVPKRRPGTEKVDLDQEIEIMPERNPFLFEGDIILSDEEMDKMIENAEDILWAQTGSNNLRRKVRSMTSVIDARWSTFEPIHYYITPGSYSNEIKNGVKFWEDNTCLTFKQKQYPLRRSGLNFIRGNGCYSMSIGQVRGQYRNQPQDVSIGYGCTNPGTVVHEIGHALGLWHEQARYDRDNYVEVMYNNIESSSYEQFQKRLKSEINDDGVKYDYGSVMHYAAWGFHINPNYPTIKTKDRNFQNTIGQRIGAVFSDVKKTNFAYCSHVCSNKLQCQHGGYEDPKNCATCRCPDGFGGDLCERASNSPSSCGVGDLTATNNFQTIQARGGTKCTYLITAPPGRQVYFEVTDSSFSFARHTCESDYLELKYGEDFASSGAKLCYKTRPTVKLSKTNQLVVIYRGGYNTRFSLKFRQDPMGPVETTPAPLTTTAVPKPVSTTAPVTTTTQKVTTSSIRCSTWSPCTAQCGGCGTQSRRCGSTLQTIRCNLQPCNNSHCCLPFFFSKDGRCIRPYGDTIVEEKIVKFYTEAELEDARKQRGGNGWYQEKN